MNFRLSLYDFEAGPPSLQNYALPHSPSHIYGGMWAAPDSPNFYFLLHPGAPWDEPAASYGLWRFEAASGEFIQAADLPDPALHLVSLEPDGEWLLLQNENGQPLYLHLLSSEAYPFEVDGSQVHVLVRRPIPEEVEPELPN
jgi:hypothetical protein